MPILERCWTPYITNPWTSVKYGSYYTAVYSIMVHIAGLTYGIYCLSCPETNHFFSFYQHLTYRGSISLSATLTVFCIFILAATVLLTSGIQQARRHLFIPWLIAMTVEVIGLAGLGISFVALSYSQMYPIVAAMILWCFDGFHLYCLLCVISHYQVLKDTEQPKFVILNS